jgi:hypothetical protein
LKQVVKHLPGRPAFHDRQRLQHVAGTDRVVEVVTVAGHEDRDVRLTAVAECPGLRRRRGVVLLPPVGQEVRLDVGGLQRSHALPGQAEGRIRVRFLLPRDGNRSTALAPGGCPRGVETIFPKAWASNHLRTPIRFRPPYFPARVS